jgi:hypothetical protein
MCLVNVKLARYVRGEVESGTAGITPAQLVTPSRDRVLLTFFPSAGGPITWSPGDSATFGSGVTLAPGDPPAHFLLTEHGALVTMGWSVVSDQATVNVQWCEQFLPEGYLSDVANLP